MYAVLKICLEPYDPVINSVESMGRFEASDNQFDGEMCSWDEFDIYDSNRVLVSVHSEED
jgi:hypothetical protein